MIRGLVFIALLIAAAYGLWLLAAQPGEVTLASRGYRIETSITLAVVALAALMVATVILWNLLRFLLQRPKP